MWGDFKAALKTSEIALRGMKKRYGERSLSTMVCAKHHSILLAFNSRIFEAEASCRSVLARTIELLGSQHPHTLETSGHLVRIFQLQGRIAMASSMANSIAEVSELCFRADHHTRRLRYLLAETLLAVGDYASAEVELEGILTRATREYGEYHPDTLSYQSWLALAKYHAGKLQEAEELAIYVLQEQWRIYTIPQSDKAVLERTHDKVGSRGSAKTLSEYQDTLNKLLKSISNNSDDLKIHPCLLQTLRTTALIAQQSEGFGNLAFQILGAIYERNKVHLNEASIFTLDSEYELALAYRQKDQELDINSLKTAADHLRLVYRKRFSILGPKHPGTVSARRELISTNCELGEWEPSLGPSEAENTNHVPEGVKDQDKGVDLLDDMRWGRIEAESHDIVSTHEESVREHHPETLKSLHWLFTVQVILRDEKGAWKTTPRSEEAVKLVGQSRCITTLIGFEVGEDSSQLY
ncbi:hypothetical protein F5B18DRAFT_608743 [Nemania serpens]|nr:hypothetical protein F5B18DRAFT_608743 [Nemania serpens]